MPHFTDRLLEAIEQKETCVVVGLDPRLDRLPPKLKAGTTVSREAAADAIVEFNRIVLEAVAPHVVAAKPQVAFYEALGWQGFRAFEETIRIAREMGLLVIADMKRGDIGSTAEAYAQACLEEMGADAVTVNGYLGSDGIEPFLKRTPQGKGIFVLVKTSNPSSVELQDLDVVGAKLYEKVAELVARWGSAHIGRTGYSAVGAVVGATFPEEVGRLRRIMPHAPLLLPGYGAQGAGAEDCKPAFDAKGFGAVVNSSRGIIFAYEKTPHAARWQDAVRDAARRMQEDLEKVRTAGMTNDETPKSEGMTKSE